MTHDGTLLQDIDRVYVRDGELVDIDTDTYTIKSLTHGSLKHHIMTVAEDHAESLYGNIAADLYNTRGKTKDFRRLDQIVTQPTFRPDFSLVPPGYDSDTHLFYIPSSRLAKHRFNPGAKQKDAEEALARLQYVFADFPFVDEASRTNTIAALLTLVIRPAIDDVVPAWTCNGQNVVSQNVGKGKLFRALIRIAEDKPATTTPIPPTPTQMLQTLSAIAKRHDTHLIFDDAKGSKQISSNDLNAFLTAETWNCKVPGTINSSPVALRIMVILNGNDLKLSVDLCNRTFWSELFHEDTQKRSVDDFRVNIDHHMELNDYVRTYRLMLLDAVITMVLAWRNAGMPKRKPSSPLVKYGQWERIVGGILEFAGATAFLDNQQAKSESADVQGTDALLLIAKLIEVFPTIENKPVRISKITAHMIAGGTLDGVLPNMPRNVLRLDVELGKYIKSIQGRVFGGHKIMSKQSTGNKSVVWCPVVLP